MAELTKMYGKQVRSIDINANGLTVTFTDFTTLEIVGSVAYNTPNIRESDGARLSTAGAHEGEIGLVWLLGNISASGKVTLADAERYVNSPEGQHLKNRYIPTMEFDEVFLLANVKRIDADTLEFDGNKYLVKVLTGGDYIFHDELKVTSEQDGVAFEVKHLSTLEALRGFLIRERKRSIIGSEK